MQSFKSLIRLAPRLQNPSNDRGAEVVCARLSSSGLLRTAIVVFLAAPTAASAAVTAQLPGEASGCIPPPRIVATRPPSGEAPTEVRVGLYLVDLHSISDAEQAFVVDLAVVVRWTDRRLAHLAGCTLDMSDIWTPQLQIVNRRNVVQLELDVVTVEGGGGVSYFQRGYGEFTVDLDLRDFPFDKQQLIMEAVSRHPASDVHLVVDPQATGLMAGLSLSGWTLGPFSHAVDTLLWEPAQLELPKVGFSILVERQPSFFVWKLILPLSLVVMMSWAVFWIDPNIVPARLGLSATAILTIFAYQFAFSDLLPRLPYLTRMDLFFIGSSALVFLGLVETVATVSVHKDDRVELARKINGVSRVLFPAAFVGVLLWSFVL